MFTVGSVIKNIIGSLTISTITSYLVYINVIYEWVHCVMDFNLDFMGHSYNEDVK